MQIKFLILFSFQLILRSVESVQSINDFKKNYFKILMTNQGFEKVTTGLEALKNYTIVYNGFIDKDLYTDLIVRSRDKKTLKFFL